MPYFTDDNSKAVHRIREIEGELQEAKLDLERRIEDSSQPLSPAEVIARERATKTLTDRIQWYRRWIRPYFQRFDRPRYFPSGVVYRLLL